MKKLIIVIIGISLGVLLNAQQMPLSENYFLDKYSLSPSYAGNFETKYLFMTYRSDWSGIDGGPKTLKLSYNDAFMQNAGFGGKFIYDKAGIFKQVMLLGTYSYRDPRINSSCSFVNSRAKQAIRSPKCKSKSANIAFTSCGDT